MTISYTGPLGRAWQRMKWILFAKRDVKKWAALGFTAWLAELASASSWWDKGGSQARSDVDVDQWGRVSTDAAHTIQEFLARGIGAVLIIGLILAALILYFVFLWLSSRGTFMFLDNVIHNRANVKAPWRHFSALGDSLFLWRVAFGVICMLAVVPIVVLFVVFSLPMIMHEAGAAVSIPGYIGTGAVFFVLIVAMVYIDFLTMHCVVPLMYKHDLKTMEAWRRFLPVFKQRVGVFVLYGFFYLLLSACVGVAVVLVGLVTCCVGWFVLAVPYVGTVLMLPVHVTLRGLDLEFLAQHGADLDLVQAFASD